MIVYDLFNYTKEAQLIAYRAVFHSRWLTHRLLEQITDPGTACNFDITPFSTAVRDASLTTVNPLLVHRADIECGQPVYYAMLRNDNREESFVKLGRTGRIRC